MSRYERPVILTGNEISEGVFAASGGTVGITYKQNATGHGTHIHTVKLADSGYDIKGTFTITYTFDQPIVVTRQGNDWQSATVSGSVLTVVYTSAITDKKNGQNNPELDQFWVAGSNGQATLQSAVGSES